MTDQGKFSCRVLSSILMIAGLSAGTVAASDPQTMQQLYRAPSQTQYAPPSEPQQQPNLPPAMRDSVAESLAPLRWRFWHAWQP